MSVYTHISFVLDKSGSMRGIMPQVLSSFNKFVRDQQALPGEASFSLYKFSNDVVTISEFENLHDMGEVRENNCDGSTSLRDAMGVAIERTMFHNVRLGGRKPGKNIIAIITDGCENTSREYSAQTIKELISTYETNWNWQFLFLGANQDAIRRGMELGISMEKALTYSTRNTGIEEAFNACNEAISLFRLGESREAFITRNARDTQNRILGTNINEIR